LYQKYCTSRKQKKDLEDEPKTVALAIQLLQEICLEEPTWNINKFANLLSMLYSFCSMSEIVTEILTPLLLSYVSSVSYLKCILVELHKLIDSHDFSTTTDLAIVLEILAVYLINSKHISKYTVDELIHLITNLKECFSEFYKNNELVYYKHYMIFFGLNNGNSYQLNVLEITGAFMILYQNKLANINEEYTDFHKEHILRYLFLKCTKEQYIKYTSEMITSYGKFFEWFNVTEICNNIIRLTFETCCLCLEFPDIGCLNNVSFLIHCLIQFLEQMQNSNKSKLFHQSACKSLNSHIVIFEPSIECTAIANAYSNLLKEWKNSNTNFETYLNTLRQFSSSCTKKVEQLKKFNGQHSPIAIKLWLAYNIINSVIHDNVNLENENHINKLGEYLKTL
jgi:hypothetical protein